MKRLLEKNLIFVSGKGGVGKSTVSLALAHAAHASGKRVLYVSLHAHDLLSAIYDREADYEETELLPGLFAMTLDAKKALHEYVIRQIRFEFLYRVAFENRAVRYFLDATPGLQDLLLLGKIFDLVEEKRRKPYDLVVVDMPATGHGVNFLRIPKMVQGMIPSGPLNRQAALMEAKLLRSSRTGLCLVTLPEEMPVNECLEMSVKLEQEVGLKPDSVVINGCYQDRFSEKQMEWIKGWREGTSDVVQHAILDAAISQFNRWNLQNDQIDRLRDNRKILGDIPLVKLPFLFAHEFDRLALAKLGQCLLVSEGNKH